MYILGTKKAGVKTPAGNITLHPYKTILNKFYTYIPLFFDHKN